MGFAFLQNMNYILRRFVQLKPSHSMQTDRQDKHEKASSRYLTILLQKRLK